MRIQHNIMAMSAYRNYTNNVSAMKKNLEKLSSGYKINRAGDDAAGLAISEKMRAQITGLETAQKNAKDGISLVQTAEGALTEVHDMLNRMVELATQSANGTYDNTTDRKQMQKEVDQLLEEINRIADSSNFNGINLLDGTLGLDTSTYTIENVAAVDAEAVDGFNRGILATKTNNATAVAGTDTILHADGKDATAGSFKIDLQQVSVTGLASDKAGKFKLSIGGVAVATLTAASSLKGKDLDAKTMAAMVATAFKGTSVGNSLYITSAGAFTKTAAAKALQLKATDNSDGTVTFTVSGFMKTAGTITAITSSNLKEAMDTVGSNAANKKLDVAVAVASNGQGTVKEGNNVGTLVITNNQKAAAGQLGNTVMTIDPTKIKDGSVLTIAGEKYTFAIGKDSAYKNADNVIDLTKIVKDASDLSNITDAGVKDDIAAAITRATAGNKTLYVGFNTTGDWTKMTLTERSDGQGKSAASVTEAMQNAMTTKAGFEKLVSLTGPEQKAGQSVSGTPSDDTSLTIGGKRFTFNKAGEGTDKNAIYIKTTDGMQGLSDALKAEGIAHEFDGTSKITVRGGTILGKGLTLQIGDTSDAFNQLNVAVQDMHSNSLGIDGLEINTEEKAQLAIKKIKDAINTVSDVRGTLGATQNRLDHTINNLSVMTENIQDAESTIRDVDIAEEMMAYTKNNILIQSAQAMLAQANQVPQGVLQLLQ